MASAVPILTFLAILAAALNAGLFFIFSVCIMAAFARLSPAEGAAAMNAINAVIQNPWFFSVFFGGALLALVLAVGPGSGHHPAPGSRNGKNPRGRAILMGWVIFGSFFLLMLIGVPIGLSIGLAALVVFLVSGIPLQMVPQTLLEGNNSFALVAVPFFVLAGDILARGGISERIVAFAEATLGRIRGGLSIVSVLASMFIAAISGSGAATTAAVGSALLPELKTKKYDVDFSAALIASAGTIGVVIPPSVPMVLYAVIAGESVAKLFMAGFIPGALMGGGLIAYARLGFCCRRRV